MSDKKFGKGPLKGAWTDEQEQQFQAYMAFDPGVRAWHNAFVTKYGEPPSINDPDFDYRAAWLAGEGPKKIEGDAVPHWGSSGKSENHPTFWKHEFTDKFGVSPDELPTHEWTQPMQNFLHKTIDDNFSFYDAVRAGMGER